MAGAARHEHEAGECRWPRGAEVGAASSDRTIWCVRKPAPAPPAPGLGARISDEPTRKPSTSGASRSTSARPSMPDSVTRMRSGRQRRQPLGRREVDAEIAKVAIVDPDQRRAERQRAAHLVLVMNLDQRVHAEAARFGDHRRAPLVIEQRQHHQHRVGAGNARLDDLARIDEEVLGEDRAIELAPAPPPGRRANRRKTRPSHSTLSASATPA